ncbi:GNAT family N-acetyltransferase [Streptomyces griseocarneus]|uniref:GNAT family N-acetyltransferase n=1 Tax=Streptomyces griseocarneus TaxID=51201 RepID=UPI00167E9409|nr:GNAT family N-acetyltransferase [Streptomyces griseocarneus]MBZ6472205.1 GNAT family N-acetyltransferase [Streptomyces griseocarneus]GHG73280.1 GNAT family acetyltransferase [Streptomyces griseocarneus]
MSSFRTPTPLDLTTDRLILRPWTRAEAAAVLDGTRQQHWADDFPAEGDGVVAGLFEDFPAWLDAYGHRLVIERESGRVVGSTGLFWPPADGTLEIGYGIVPSRRGRGYAPEAARALAEFALTSTDVHTVFATVELSNPPSIRVLEKAGFERWSAAGAGGAEDGVVRFRFVK